jgi:hypothetical protein
VFTARYALRPYIKPIRLVLQALILRRIRATVVEVEKAISITYSQCVSVALDIQHANRIFCASYYAAICGLSGCTFFFFPHYLINGRISEKKKWPDIKCLFWFCLRLLSEISHSNWYSAKYYHKWTYVFM